jgi:hypothetical protein
VGGTVGSKKTRPVPTIVEPYAAMTSFATRLG